MKRRDLLINSALALAAVLPTSPVAQARSSTPRNATRWKVRTSEGFDAIAFLGPLSGEALYREHYAADADAFAPLLETAVHGNIVKLWQAANADGFGLLGPNLQVLFSAGGHDGSLNALLRAIRGKDEQILPHYRASRYWNEADWAWFSKAAPRIEAIFSGLLKADFAAFRTARIGMLEKQVAEVQQALSDYDVISWQTKLTGHEFEPTIEVVLLQFAKPHGIKVQGQKFLQSADYDTATTVRIAAHEMLHPPYDPLGVPAQAALKVFRSDPLITKIVRDHDPKWGYTTLEGLLDEDLVEALDQLISEALGVARDPAERWNKADDGIHVIAAGLYGLLKDDRWAERGGSIENWLLRAAMSGRLNYPGFHQSAARVLKRPADRLWPVVQSPSV